ncbi:unnamed protein product [Closterium sp. NIES-65]|nr:unnamed protein product [Closterium sp. NIES-65]
MQYNRLGESDLVVSRICLGTMLFGEALSYQDASAQLSRAVEGGVNFFDTAEMYPVPQRAETQGRSGRPIYADIVDKRGALCLDPGFPQVVGPSAQMTWIKGGALCPRPRTFQVAGPSAQMTWIRGGPFALDPVNITSAIDTSLQRLQCDYIDLLQLHWPDRYVPMFGDWEFDPRCDYNEYSSFEAQLEALGRAVDAGKVRYIGLSNETAWGLGKFLEAASQPATPSSSSPLCPRPIALQNAYSLLCRTFDSTLAESCHHEHIPLLAYSPLAMGLLSGKYHCSPQMLSGKHRSSPSADPATSANADTSADAATSASIDTVLLLAQSLDLHQSSDPTDTNNRIFQDPSWRLVKYRNRYAEAEGRYPISNPRVATAVRAYADVARRFHVSPVQLALAFVLAHPLVGAAVVGASCLQQLEEILSVVGEGGGGGSGRGEGIEFTEEMRAAVDAVHSVLPNPTP